MTGTLPERAVRPVGLRLDGLGWRPVGCARPVLGGVDLVVEPGERVLVTGPSGAGKSTLLRAVAGVLGADVEGSRSGRVLVDGQDTERRPPPAGLVLQRPADALVADRVGRDVAFGPENLGLPRDQIRARVAWALAVVGFPYGPETPTRTLSGGEAQRLALAGVLAMRPGLLLLDEPAAMLDDESAGDMRTAVAGVVAATGTTLVVVEHRIGPWLPLVDRLVVLDRAGHVIADGEPAGVLRSTGDTLASEGVWVPGLAAPAPTPLPAGLVGELHPPAGEPWLRARGLGVRLRSRGLRGTRVHQALDQVSLDLAATTVTALIGRSGAGKSTLLAALGGLLVPTAGWVRAAAALAAGLHVSPSRWRSAELARRVGWVPQDAEHGLVSHRAVDEVAATSRRLGRPVDAEALLDAVGLGAVAGSDPYRLSGGEQRRLALVAALGHGPPVALLDEPTVGQDRHTWAAVAGWLHALAVGGRTVAVATHDRVLVDVLDAREVRLSAGRAGGSR